MVDPVLDPERERFIAAIDRRRAGIDEMTDLPGPRQLEHVDLPHEVGADIGLRIDERIANPGLGTQVDDPVETPAGGEIRKRLFVAEIDLFEAEAIAVRAGQRGDPCLLQRRIVIIVDVVDAGDFLAAREQGFRYRIADEAGGAGNEDGHGKAS